MNINLSTETVTLSAVPIQGPPGVPGASAFIPGGRLTLVSGQAIMPHIGDHTSSTIYYAPYISDQVPLFDGVSWNTYVFTTNDIDQIGLSLAGNWGNNTQRDVFITLIDNIPHLCTGPAWPGESLLSRGLIKHRGLWVNSGPILCDVSYVSKMVIDPYKALWVGSINIGNTINQLTATFSLGQNRRCDIWNVYNQTEIRLGVGCPPPQMTGAVFWRPDNQYPAWKAFNNDINNSGYYFTGFPQDIKCEYFQRAFVDSLNFGICAAVVVICKDVISNGKGFWMNFSSDNTQTADGVSGNALFIDRASIGSHRAIMGTANANNTTGITMWGLVYLPNRSPEDTHVMWITYLG